MLISVSIKVRIKSTDNIQAFTINVKHTTTGQFIFHKSVFYAQHLSIKRIAQMRNTSVNIRHIPIIYFGEAIVIEQKYMLTIFKQRQAHIFSFGNTFNIYRNNPCKWRMLSNHFQRGGLPIAVGCQADADFHFANIMFSLFLLISRNP